MIEPLAFSKTQSRPWDKYIEVNTRLGRGMAGNIERSNY